MAEFCLDCWNKLNDTQDPKSRYVMTRKPELCEGCGQFKKVIIEERGYFSAVRLLLEIAENFKK